MPTFADVERFSSVWRRWKAQVDLELDGVQDPELEVVHARLAMDHPDDLEGNQQQGQLGGQEMRKASQLQVEEFPH